MPIVIIRPMRLAFTNLNICTVTSINYKLIAHSLTPSTPCPPYIRQLLVTVVTPTCVTITLRHTTARSFVLISPSSYIYSRIMYTNSEPYTFKSVTISVQLHSFRLERDGNSDNLHAALYSHPRTIVVRQKVNAEMGWNFDECKLKRVILSSICADNQ